MMKGKMEKRIVLFVFFQMLVEPLFWAPVIIMYIQKVGGMSLPQIYIMESVVVFGMVFIDIVSSSYSDLVSRKNVLILGAFLHLVAIISFSFVNSPLFVWVANIFVMSGSAMILGVGEAFLVDTAKELNLFHRYRDIYGHVNASRYLAMAVGSLAGGYLYKIDPHLPMFLSIPGVAVSVILSFFLEEPPRVKKREKIKKWELIKKSIIFSIKNKAVRWIIVYAAAISSLAGLWFFTYNPYFQWVELDTRYFGWIFCVLNILSFLGSTYSDLIVKRAGEGLTIFFLAFLPIIAVLLMAFFMNQYATLLLVFGTIHRGIGEVFLSHFINSHLDSSNRATILSAKSSISSLIKATALWVFGLVLARWSLPISMKILGIFFLGINILIFWRYKIIFRE